MADEPNKSDDIESILSDLDSILSDKGGAAPAPVPEPPAKAPPPKIEALTPSPAPAAVIVPPPAIAVPPPPPPAAVPPPAIVVPPPPPPPKATTPVSDTPRGPEIIFSVPKPKEPAESRGPEIELAPRDGMIKPPEKKPEPPKPAPKLPDQKSIELFATPAPAEPVKAPEPEAAAPVAASQPVVPEPKPTPPPAAAPPAPAPAPTAAAPAEPADASKPGEFDPKTPKEQIRRVAYAYTAPSAEVKLAFAAFLSQAARTISKKPLFLREVMAIEVGAASDANAVVQKALQAKAASVLAVVEGWPLAKIDELSDACARANLLFRSVASADAQKKSTAVDIIVDMMLLPGEA